MRLTFMEMTLLFYLRSPALDETADPPEVTGKWEKLKGAPL